MESTAQAVLEALGGRNNVLTNTVCMTRLRVTLRDPLQIDFEALNSVPIVLGTATRGVNGVEVVFGPRVIDGVYHAFLSLTGIEAGTDALFPMSRQESRFRVQINASKKAVNNEEQLWQSDHMDANDIDTLKGLFSDTRDAKKKDPVSPAQTSHLRLLVINGPNINMIGLGTQQNTEIGDFSDILELCKHTAQQEGFAKCVCLQSNHEGDLVDWVQDAWGSYDAIVINPSTYAPTSHTLRDAVRNVGLPTVQVHLDVPREGSCLNSACIKNIVGKGVAGYELAIQAVAKECRTLEL